MLRARAHVHEHGRRALALAGTFGEGESERRREEGVDGVDSLRLGALHSVLLALALVSSARGRRPQEQLGARAQYDALAREEAVDGVYVAHVRDGVGAVHAPVDVDVAAVCNVLALGGDSERGARGGELRGGRRAVRADDGDARGQERRELCVRRWRRSRRVSTDAGSFAATHA